jgi:hypothetical protein
VDGVFGDASAFEVARLFADQLVAISAAGSGFEQPARGRPEALAETPGIAAGVLLPQDDGVPSLRDGLAAPVVLAVDVSGLDLFFELGEARHHGARIDPSRLEVLDPQPMVNMTGWSDPAWRRNHSECLALLGYPLDRRLLNAAEDELRRRNPYGAFDEHRFRDILDAMKRE